MSQLFLQRFEYREAIDKSAYDAAWGIANEAMARTGNWGTVQNGLKHIHGYGTAFGAYALLEIEDPKALEEYQLFHINNYAHMVTVTFEPLVDLDAATAPIVAEIKAKL